MQYGKIQVHCHYSKALGFTTSDGFKDVFPLPSCLCDLNRCMSTICRPKGVMKFTYFSKGGLSTTVLLSRRSKIDPNADKIETVALLIFLVILVWKEGIEKLL